MISTSRFTGIIVPVAAIFAFLASFFTVAQDLGGGPTGIVISALIAIIAALAANTVLSTHKKSLPELKPPTVDLSINDLVIRRSFNLRTPLKESVTRITQFLESQGYLLLPDNSSDTFLEFAPDPFKNLRVLEPERYSKLLRDYNKQTKKGVQEFHQYIKSTLRGYRPTYPTEVLIALQPTNPSITTCHIELRPRLYRQLTMPDVYGSLKEEITRQQVEIARHDCLNLIERMAATLTAILDTPTGP